VQVKVSEVIGQSNEGWRSAVQNAVNEAGRTMKNITGVEVINFTAAVENGQVKNFKTDVKIAYTE
jgi:flavin-binding protein dodecin